MAKLTLANMKLWSSISKRRFAARILSHKMETQPSSLLPTEKRALRAILKPIQAATEEGYAITTGLCEVHEYLADKYNIPCVQVMVSDFHGTLRAPQQLAVKIKPLVFHSLIRILSKVAKVNLQDATLATKPFCPACDNLKAFKAFHKAWEIMREASEADMQHDVRAELGAHEPRPKHAFLMQAVRDHKRYNKILRHAKLQWVLMNAAGEKGEVRNEEQKGRETKVQFVLPYGHRADKNQRRRSTFNRRAMLYVPGRWACKDEEGYVDTSCALDKEFIYEVEVERVFVAQLKDNEARVDVASPAFVPKTDSDGPSLASQSPIESVQWSDGQSAGMEVSSDNVDLGNEMEMEAAEGLNMVDPMVVELQQVVIC